MLRPTPTVSMATAIDAGSVLWVGEVTAFFPLIFSYSSMQIQLHNHQRPGLLIIDTSILPVFRPTAHKSTKTQTLTPIHTQKYSNTLSHIHHRHPGHIPLIDRCTIRCKHTDTYSPYRQTQEYTHQKTPITYSDPYIYYLLVVSHTALPCLLPKDSSSFYPLPLAQSSHRVSGGSCPADRVRSLYPSSGLAWPISFTPKASKKMPV